MSKRRLVVPCLVQALAGVGASSAQAQISPAPNTFTLGGTLTFTTFGGPPVPCNVTMTINIAPGGMSGSVTNFTATAGHLFCHSLRGDPTSWPVLRLAPSPTPRFQISGIRLYGLFAYCDNGVMNVEWTGGSPGSGNVVTQGVMPGTWNSNPYPAGYCKLDGPMSVISGGPVSVL